MNACIYARTSRVEKRHNTTSIENQVAFCRDLAWQHNLHLDDENIYTDRDMLGALLPSNWVFDDGEGRPALGAMLEHLEEHPVDRIIVRRFEKLGTSSEILTGLVDCFQARGIRVVSCPDQLTEPDNEAGCFAASILRPVIQFDTEAERERKQQLRAQKRDEIKRLLDKVHRLEAEISELS